ncbi:replication protein P, partial [Escherichia coli]
QIPDPILSIQAKPEPMSTPPTGSGNAYHPPGRSFGCMPNAATLGGITPAQWLMEEYRRGKAAGLIK